MAMTLEQLRARLSEIEPGESMYAAIGPAEVPILQQLLHDPEAWMASRAVFALTRIANPQAVQALAQAAGDGREEVRVAVAAGARQLPAEHANTILVRMLRDTQLGVRKFAIQSVSKEHSREVHRALDTVRSHDPAPVLRSLAHDRVQDLRNR